jgi:hypothetical protein
MKRIIAVSTLAVATCLGFTSAAKADTTATSTHSGKVTPTCAVAAVSGLLGAVANTNGFVNGNFPKVLSSSGAAGGVEGAFMTLCNTDPSQISVAVGTVTVPAGQTGHTTEFALFGSGTVYPTAFLTNYASTTTASSTAVTHAFSDSPAIITVTAKITAATGKVLVGSTTAYSVPITATLTP